MDHFQLFADTEDINNPQGRAARYASSSYNPKKPIALRCWLHHNRAGTLPAAWSDIGVPQQQGQVLDVLFESGQTSALLVCFIENVQWFFLSLPQSPRQLIRIYHIKPTGKDILWPFNHILWTDRAVAAEQLDNVVHLWPRLLNNRMDHITEPFRVVSLFLRDKGRIGLGLVPDFATAPVLQNYKPRPLHETHEHDPRRFVDQQDSMRPSLVLWGVENRTEDYATLLQARRPQGPENIDEWTVSNDAYAGVRLLQRNPAGGDPMLWGPAKAVHGVSVLDAVLSGDILESAKYLVEQPAPTGVKHYDVKELPNRWWCTRCLAESRGLDRTRAVENGLCVLHLRLSQAAPMTRVAHITCAVSPRGRHKWSRISGRIPTCEWCGELGGAQRRAPEE